MVEYIQDSKGIPFPDVQRAGSNIANDLLKMSYDSEREEYITEQFFNGHIPSSCRNFFPVEINFIGNVSKKKRKITIWVSGEYLSLGTDLDYIRCPIDPLTAQLIANKLNCVLPTPTLVDEIWKSADIKLTPMPWGPPYNSSMMSSDRLIKHSKRIDAQIKNMGIDPSGKFLAGHKKNVVMHNVLEVDSQKVAIYGWHQPDGKPIQALYYNSSMKTWNPYTGHINTYKDYSHGIRFVDSVIWIEKENDPSSVMAMSIEDAAIDDELWPAFGKEPQRVWRQPHS